MADVIANAVDPNNPTPVGMPSTDFTNPATLASHYESAAGSGDPAAMYSLATRAKGTPLQDHFFELANGMQKRQDEFLKEAKPAIDAGGLNTPQGRQVVADKWQTMADKPQKWRAFTEMLMGNPNWRLWVNGGNVKTEIKYDQQGNPLQYNTNELGQIVGVKDLKSGQDISPEQFGQMGGAVNSLENTLGYKQKTQQLQEYQTKATAANETANAYGSAAPVLNDGYTKLRQMFTNLRGDELPDNVRNQIGLFTQRSLNLNQSLSNGFNVLRQLSNNKNANISVQDKKDAEMAASAAGFVKGKVSGEYQKATGESITNADLDQAQSNLSKSNALEQGFQQSKKDFLENQVMQSLSAGQKETIGAALDTAFQLDRQQAEMKQKYGSLPFLLDPKTFEIGDHFLRGESQAAIGQFNAQAMKMYSDFRSQMLSHYPKGSVPAPGEIEAAFAKTPEFNSLRQNFADQVEKLQLYTPVGAAYGGSKSPAAYGSDLGFENLPSTSKPNGPVAPPTTQKTPVAPKLSSMSDVQGRIGGSSANKPSLEELASQFRSKK